MTNRTLLAQSPRRCPYSTLQAPCVPGAHAYPPRAARQAPPVRPLLAAAVAEAAVNPKAAPPWLRHRGPPGDRGDDAPGGRLHWWGACAPAAATTTMVATPMTPLSRCFAGGNGRSHADADRLKDDAGRKVTEVSSAAQVDGAVSTAVADDSSISSIPTERMARPAYETTASRLIVPSGARCALLIAAMSWTIA